MEANAKANKTVLIIEDDFASKEFFIELLDEFDVNILTADNGTAVFDILKVSQVDLIFLDIKLPDISGLEVIKRIRNVHGDKIKVIAQTANAFRKYTFYEDAGFDGYLSKPINTSEFKSLVANLLSL